jgi:hypothetical protein
MVQLQAINSIIMYLLMQNQANFTAYGGKRGWTLMKWVDFTLDWKIEC